MKLVSVLPIMGVPFAPLEKKTFSGRMKNPSANAVVPESLVKRSFMSAPNTSGVPPSPVVTTRSERVAQRSGSRGVLARIAAFFKTDHRGRFILLTFFTSIALGCAIRAWNKPFRYRVNRVSERAIICNAPFSIPSPEQKESAIHYVRLNTPHVFINDTQPLLQLRDALWNTIAVLVGTNSYDELSEEDQLTWLDFLRPNGQGSISDDIDPEAAFNDFVLHFKTDNNFTNLKYNLNRVFQPFYIRGVLRSLPFVPERGSQDKVLVYRIQDTPDRSVEHKVSDILFRDGSSLREALRREMKNEKLGDQFFNWLYLKFPETLKEDLRTTAQAEEEAVSQVEDVYVDYLPGQLLVNAGVLLQQNDINLLLAEYNTSLHHQSQTAAVVRFAAVSSVFFIVLAVIIALVFRIERRRPRTAHTFFYLMLGMILTVAAAQYFPFMNADTEILPLILFVMLVSIVYSWELAAILSIFLTFVIVCGNGGSMHLFIILLCTAVLTAVQLGRLRTRGKLVVVATVAGIVAAFLTITMGIQADRSFDRLLLTDAASNFLWALLAGLLMTGVLPFIEKQFGILTDMRLLEFGDVSHPLLQTLIKVAPATYGHCMQVGSIAETAADAINARGLLTRVGSYFHDIGKIMKPEYYSENQGGLENVHDTIKPQISTIVLVAHVKDGVDLARQYHLPKPLVDLIEQHHGTSLVSFFYGKATTGGTEEVEESTFRYPGPKPQTKEAAILMIADTCESACRSMGVGIPPNKIEGKVRALVKQKLDDGQFDDSGLTLRELKLVEKSVIGSIVAAMHGRVQYPEGAGKHGHQSNDVDNQTVITQSLIQKVAHMG